MLSKVLSGRDAGRAQPAVFAPVTRPQHAPQRQPENIRERDADEHDRLTHRIRALEAELRQVRQEAFENGRTEGEQTARAEIAPVLERMSASLAELTGMRHDIRRRAEKDVVELSLLIAKRILHREVNLDINALNALAKVVFERLTRAEAYSVVVHPRFADAIRTALPGSQMSRVTIEPDPSAALGTLIVRSREGLIDASVDAQLEEINRGLTDRLNAG